MSVNSLRRTVMRLELMAAAMEPTDAEHSRVDLDARVSAMALRMGPAPELADDEARALVVVVRAQLRAQLDEIAVQSARSARDCEHYALTQARDRARQWATA